MLRRTDLPWQHHPGRIRDGGSSPFEGEADDEAAGAQLIKEQR